MTSGFLLLLLLKTTEPTTEPTTEELIEHVKTSKSTLTLLLLRIVLLQPFFSILIINASFLLVTENLVRCHTIVPIISLVRFNLHVKLNVS